MFELCGAITFALNADGPTEQLRNEEKIRARICFFSQRSRHRF